MVPEADNKALVTNPWHDIYRWHFHLGEIDPCGLQGFEDVFAREPSPRLYTHTLRSANVKLSSTSSGRNALRCKCLITNPIFSLVVNISTPQCWKSTKAASSSLFAAFSYRDSIQFAVWPCNFCGAGHGEKKLERGSASTGESSAACHLFLRPETNLLEFWWAKIYSRVLWFGGLFLAEDSIAPGFLCFSGGRYFPAMVQPRHEDRSTNARWRPAISRQSFRTGANGKRTLPVTLENVKVSSVACWSSLIVLWGIKTITPLICMLRRTK